MQIVVTADACRALLDFDLIKEPSSVPDRLPANRAKVPTPPNDTRRPSKKVALQRSANRLNDRIFRILSSNSTSTDPDNPNMTMQSEDYSIIEARIEEAIDKIKK